MSDGGKGSTQRPVIDWKKFEENWDEIFNVGNKRRDNPNPVLRDGQNDRLPSGQDRCPTHEPGK